MKCDDIGLLKFEGIIVNKVKPDGTFIKYWHGASDDGLDDFINRMRENNESLESLVVYRNYGSKEETETLDAYMERKGLK